MQRRKFTSGVDSVGGLWALTAWPTARPAGITESDAALGVRAALERARCCFSDRTARQERRLS